MKKIAITTLNGYFNYGNRLQNYALQEVLKLYGYDVESVIVSNKPKYKNKPVLNDRLKNMFSLSFKEIFNKTRNKIEFRLRKKNITKSNQKRIKIFKEFTLNHINETDYAISDFNIPTNLIEKYDFFITGSDQVWNPNYNYGSSIYFLTFAPKEKRIAYAPSFGVSVIKSEFTENYKEWLLGINKISVREDDGARIIKELTGREVPVLVDPTMLLTKEKWLSIAKGANNKPKDKYLLTYFIAGMPEKYKKIIDNIVKKNDLKIIRLYDVEEKETYETGPSEFIDYINSCSILCTDSFHGAVFSILLKKPFIVYERASSSPTMYSRINTLLDKFGLESRRIENIKNSQDFFNIDYSHISPILEKERNKAFKYLKEALNIQDRN